RVLVVAGEQAAGEIELKKSGETAIELEDAGRIGAVHEARQSGHRLLIDLQIHSRVFVSRFGHSPYLLGKKVDSRKVRRELSTHPSGVNGAVRAAVLVQTESCLTPHHLFWT